RSDGFAPSQPSDAPHLGNHIGPLVWRPQPHILPPLRCLHPAPQESRLGERTTVLGGLFRNRLQYPPPSTRGRPPPPPSPETNSPAAPCRPCRPWRNTRGKVPGGGWRSRTVLLEHPVQ